MDFSFKAFKAELGEGEKPPDPAKVAMENLLKHLPGEATALYLAGLDIVRADPTKAVTAADGPTLLVISAVSLVVLFLVRSLAKASRTVMVTSAICFLIWIYALGNGPFQAYGLELAKGMGGFLVIAYSTIITILTQYGKIK